MCRQIFAVFLFLIVGQLGAAEDGIIANPYAPTPVRAIAPQAPVPPKVAVLRQKMGELAQLQQEIRQLRVDTGTQQQILVRVQMLEVNLAKMQRLGLDVSSLKSGYTNVNDIAGLAKATNSLGGMPYTNSAAKGHTPGADGLIDFLLENNIAKVLSEPTVVAIDGRPSSFNMGGEIPIPAKPDSKQAVEFRPYGTQLDILPISLGDNRVRLEMKIRVSEVDYSRTIQFNGVSVPGLSVRQIDTAVETSFSQSVVLNGLVEERTEVHKMSDRIEQQKYQIALVLIVTPEAVDAPATAQRPNGQVMPK